MSDINFPDDDGPSIDELFKIVTIDRKRKVRQVVQLKDEDGDEISIKEAIQSITEYVSDKLKSSEENSCKQQIMPLMAQAMVGGLSKLMGRNLTASMLCQEHIRYGLMHMMTVSFHFLKWIQKKGIKIHTTEYHLTQEDIDTFERVSRATDASTAASLMGYSGKDLIKEMLKRGEIKKGDLEMLGLTDIKDEETKQGTN